MSLRTQSAYLQHIHDAATSVLEYTEGGEVAFFASKMVQDAVLRNLEVIGEAVKALANETRNRAPEIPWRRIAGMRDVLIHHYFGVDLKVVWLVVDTEIPRLLAVTNRLMDELAIAGR